MQRHHLKGMEKLLKITILGNARQLSRKRKREERRWLKALQLSVQYVSQEKESKGSKNYY
jgi:hypothetical protein